MKTEPRWALVRAAVPFSAAGRNFARNELATVDLTDDGIKDYLRAQLLIPLPAAQQPMLQHDPATNQPQLIREGSDGY